MNGIIKDGLARLREPFPADQINKLPKPTISNDEWKKLPKGKCTECGGWHATSKTVHLDFVGHAALTARLLEVDEGWTWAPFSVGQDGYPVIDKDGGMWITLTVCGVTRLGYGDAQGKTGGNAMKERIGDALRNAAMRFGAALDLWHRGEAPLFQEENTEEKCTPEQEIKAELANQEQADLYAEFCAEIDKLGTSEELTEWGQINQKRINNALTELWVAKLKTYFVQVKAIFEKE